MMPDFFLLPLLRFPSQALLPLCREIVDDSRFRAPSSRPVIHLRWLSIPP